MLEVDEGYQALMAKDIATGIILPITQYQLPYVGAFEEFLIAALMAVFSPTLFVFKTYLFLSSILILVVGKLFFDRYFVPRDALLPFCLLSFLPGPFLISLQWGWSFSALLWMSFLMFYMAMLISGKTKKAQSPALLYALIGLLMGLALYNNILSLFVILSCLFYLFSTLRNVASRLKLSLMLACGIVVGYLPMIVFNVINKGITYQVLAAKFLDIHQADLDQYGLITGSLHAFERKLTSSGASVTLHGLYPGWNSFSSNFSSSQGTLLFTLVATALILLFIAIAYARWFAETYRQIILKTYAFSLRDALYIFLPFTCLTSTCVHYATAAIPFFCVIAAEGFVTTKTHRKWLASCSLAIALIASLNSNLEAIYCGKQDHRGTVLSALQDLHLTHGYGDYTFQGYLAFLSDNQIKLSPQTGPFSFVDKIPAFSVDVDQAQHVFYLLPAYHATTEAFVNYMKLEGIACRHMVLGEDILFYGFTKRFFPRDFLPVSQLKHYYRWSYRENPNVMKRFTGGR
jgi:hypothetical protein